MKYTISPDRKALTVHVDDEERQELRDIEKCGGDCQRDVSMRDFLEPLACNSELEWIDPADTGDLTTAPMLGILGQEMSYQTCNATGCYGFKPSGSDGIRKLVRPITERWAFMDYQVRSVLEDLRDTGQAIFTS